MRSNPSVAAKSPQSTRGRRPSGCDHDVRGRQAMAPPLEDRGRSWEQAKRGEIPRTGPLGGLELGEGQAPAVPLLPLQRAGARVAGGDHEVHVRSLGMESAALASRRREQLVADHDRPRVKCAAVHSVSQAPSTSLRLRPQALCAAHVERRPNLVVAGLQVEHPALGSASALLARDRCRNVVRSSAGRRAATGLVSGSGHALTLERRLSRERRRGVGRVRVRVTCVTRGTARWSGSRLLGRGRRAHHRGHF